MMRSLVSEFSGLQSEVIDLKDTLEKEQEKSEEQMSVLADEMDAQIASKEKSARNEERKKAELKMEEEKNKYEEKIGQLQEAVDKLKSINEKFSLSSPLQQDNDRLREKIRKLMEENSALSCNVTEKNTRILLLESEVSQINLKLQEKNIEIQRENEAAEFALAERDNMERQLSSISNDNRKLRDYNDEVRHTIMGTNFLNISRNTRHLSRSMNSLNSSNVLNEYSPIKNLNTINVQQMDRDQLMECDPSYVPQEPRDVYMEDDDDVASINGDVMNTGFEMDSGVGTVRGEAMEESDLENERQPVQNEVQRRKTRSQHKKSNFPRKITYGQERISHQRTHSSPVMHMRKTAHTPPLPRRPNHRPNQSSRRCSNTTAPSSVKDYYYTDYSSDEGTFPSRGASRAVVSPCQSERTIDTISTYRKKLVESHRYHQVIPSFDIQSKIQEEPTITTKTRLYKIILCGDSNTGKSSFSLRFCKDEFLEKQRSTLGVDFRLRTIHVEHNRPVTLQMWDTAGQERFRSLSVNYFRRADGVVLMYDVTNVDSFINVREWMDSIMDSSPEGIPVLLCANKTDLRGKMMENGDQQFVTSSEGAQLASSYGVFFMETSAASGANVDSAMLSLARHLKEKTDNDKGDIKKLTGIPKQQGSCCRH